MSRSLGRCALRTGDIRLNARLLDGPEAALLEVACHEAAHAASYILHGPKARPHGREWKALMRAAGYQPIVRWPEHWGQSPFSSKTSNAEVLEEKGDCPLSPLQRLLGLLR
jgi:predicted SprT family Zn-dependent metalloprotease